MCFVLNCNGDIDDDDNNDDDGGGGGSGGGGGGGGGGGVNTTIKCTGIHIFIYIEKRTYKTKQNNLWTL